MTITVLDPKRIVTHVARVMVDDLEVTYDLFNILEDLDNFDAAFIHDEALADDLERRGFVVRKVRDGYGAGPQLALWLQAALKAGIGQALAESAGRKYADFAKESRR